MLASAPFDDWWHNALRAGREDPEPAARRPGARASGAPRRRAGHDCRCDEPQLRCAPPHAGVAGIVVGGNIMVALLTLFMEKTVRPLMHLGSFYFDRRPASRPVLAAMQGATGWRWAATSAVVYSVFLLALLWIFPLVPAQPKLGPVLVPVTCLLPPEFPLLLLPAALALDLAGGAAPVRERRGGGRAAFPAIFLAVQWPFAEFLMSPAARNFFWGARYFDFAMPAWSRLPPLLFLWEPAACDRRRWSRPSSLRPSRWRRASASAAGWRGCGDEARVRDCCGGGAAPLAPSGGGARRQPRRRARRDGRPLPAPGDHPPARRHPWNRADRRRALDDDVRGVSVVPLPLRGEGAARRRCPTSPVQARRRAALRSALWLMHMGPWQIRIDGRRRAGPRHRRADAGAGAHGAPDAALFWLVLLFALLALLVAAAIAIAGAGASRPTWLPARCPTTCARGGRRHGGHRRRDGAVDRRRRRWWSGRRRTTGGSCTSRCGSRRQLPPKR